MKEFVEKLIERLEERKEERAKQYKRASMEDGSYMLSKCFAEGVRAYKNAIEIVNQLAEEYNNGWIPCSERLPEEGKPVLTCDKGGWISVNINTPYNGKKNDFECGYYVAWQPLPKPYKEKECDGE